ncbi:lachesin-like, partial [Cryptotermes secundus]|uniref:lachesin-like n=1 Tax=Cryptotermes secundus TaxID=105785 RepID=UPI000CD7DE09
QSVEGEMLSLTKVTRSEMGAYLCIAANGVPPSVSKRMMVHVHFHPLIQVPNQLVGAPKGTDVTLQCHVEASPKAINYWTRESGEMIIANEKYNMTEINSSYYSVQMRLTVRNFRKSDFGGYKCISKNSIGDAEGNIRLYEMELPNRMKSALEREDLDLEASNEADSEPGQHLYNGYQGPLRESGDGGVVGGEPGEDGSSVASSWNYASRLFSALVLIHLL